MDNPTPGETGNACKPCPISKTACEGPCVYAEILEKVSLGIIGMDTRDRVVFYQNQLARELFQGTIAPLDYNALSSLLLPRELPSLSASERGEAQSIRYGARTIGYTLYPVSDRYYWIYVNDITEKERLSSIAEAISIMNNTGYIFSGIRHELGNPVNSIKMTMQVLKKNLRKYSTEKIEKYLDQTLSEVDRADYILKTLQSFSMYEKLRLEDVGMRTFIERVISMIRRDLLEKGIAIRSTFKRGDEIGYMDARAMQQVMLNLLTNAADALKESKAPQITINVFHLDKRVVITVNDNGKGIPNGELQHLFKPFYSTKERGNGLGMVVVKNMMAKMNGTVEVESFENSGTTVTLTLPRGREEI